MLSHTRGCSDTGAWKKDGFMKTEKTEENWRKQKCFSACWITVNPTQSDARFNCSYTVSTEHQIIWHRDSTTFICNVLIKSVYSLHWYCFVQWYFDQYKILENMAINLQHVTSTAALFVKTWQIYKKLWYPACTATARTRQHYCHYYSLLQLSVATRVNMLSDH